MPWFSASSSLRSIGRRLATTLPAAAWLLDHNDADGQPAAAVVSALTRTTSTTGELTRDEVQRRFRASAFG
jgi:hypothetical protein